jgi:hypothetical protein
VAAGAQGRPATTIITTAAAAKSATRRTHMAVCVLQLRQMGNITRSRKMKSCKCKV